MKLVNLRDISGVSGVKIHLQILSENIRSFNKYILKFTADLIESMCLFQDTVKAVEMSDAKIPPILYFFRAFVPQQKKV